MTVKSLPPDVIELATFDQLLEMDEDEPGFSQGLVQNFFDQADTTMKEMGILLAQKDLNGLSRQGHFLKGSAAALGIIKVKRNFEKIQYLGQGKDESGSGQVSHDEAISRIGELLDNVTGCLKEARHVFVAYYGSL